MLVSKAATPDTQPTSSCTSGLDLGSETEPKSADAARAAWMRLRAHQCWSDWRLVIKHLAEGSAVAMRLAGKNERKGRRYNEEYGGWLKDEGFADVSKTTRHCALQCADHLDEIEVFLAGLKLEQRLKLNHPSSVLSAWKRTLAKPAASSEKLKPSLKAAWFEATFEERRKFLDAIGLDSILDAMPSIWREILTGRISGLQRSKQQSKQRTPLEKATVALRQALSLNESSGAAATNGVASALGGIRNLLAAQGLSLHDVEIVVEPFAKAKPKVKRAA
jgi:hypothetical protein